MNTPNAQPPDAEFWKRTALAILFFGGVLYATYTFTCSSIQKHAEVTKADAPQESPVSAGPGVGDDCRVRMADSPKRVIAFDTEAGLDEYVKAAVARDDIGIRQVLDREAFPVESGTKCRVIESSFGKRRVRLLEGAHAERAGWLIMEYVTK